MLVGSPGAYLAGAPLLSSPYRVDRPDDSHPRSPFRATSCSPAGARFLVWLLARSLYWRDVAFRGRSRPLIDAVKRLSRPWDPRGSRAFSFGGRWGRDGVTDGGPKAVLGEGEEITPCSSSSRQGPRRLRSS